MHSSGAFVSSFFVSLSHSAGIAKLFASIEEERGMISQKVIVGWFIESQFLIIARESVHHLGQAKNNLVINLKFVSIVII